MWKRDSSPICGCQDVTKSLSATFVIRWLSCWMQQEVMRWWNLNERPLAVFVFAAVVLRRCRLWATCSAAMETWTRWVPTRSQMAKGRTTGCPPAPAPPPSPPPQTHRRWGTNTHTQTMAFCERFFLITTHPWGSLEIQHNKNSSADFRSSWLQRLETLDLNVFCGTFFSCITNFFSCPYVNKNVTFPDSVASESLKDKFSKNPKGRHVSTQCLS